MNYKYILAIIFSIATLSSCKKEVQSEPVPGKAIGEIYVTAAPGTRSVLVKLDGLWRVRTTESWLHTDVQGREGEAAFTFSFDSNESDFVNFKPVRRGAIVIQPLATMVADTLWVVQQGIPDGKEYDSLPQDSYIEFPQNQLKTVTVLYANVKGASAPSSWISSNGADINCIIADDGLSVKLSNGADADVIGRITSPDAVFAKAHGPSLALADFGEEPEDEGSYYNAAVKLLSSSYDRPEAEENWLVGGSFYYLSVMEAGYPATPSWYPENPAAPEFAADRYVQSSNLTDCVWMTQRNYTPTWTSGGQSWRADYVYASHSLWNATVSVKVLENVPAGASHKAILIKIKF